MRQGQVGEDGVPRANRPNASLAQEEVLGCDTGEHRLVSDQHTLHVHMHKHGLPAVDRWAHGLALAARLGRSILAWASARSKGSLKQREGCECTWPVPGAAANGSGRYGQQLRNGALVCILVCK